MTTPESGVAALCANAGYSGGGRSCDSTFVHARMCPSVVHRSAPSPPPPRKWPGALPGRAPGVPLTALTTALWDLVPRPVAQRPSRRGVARISTAMDRALSHLPSQLQLRCPRPGFTELLPRPLWAGSTFHSCVPARFPVGEARLPSRALGGQSARRPRIVSSGLRGSFGSWEARPCRARRTVATVESWAGVRSKVVRFSGALNRARVTALA